MEFTFGDQEGMGIIMELILHMAMITAFTFSLGFALQGFWEMLKLMVRLETFAAIRQAKEEEKHGSE